MLQIKITDSFKAGDLERAGIRRGFIIPYLDGTKKVAIVIDNEKSVDHEKSADDFVYASVDKILEIIKKYNPELDDAEIQKFMSLYGKIKNDYENNDKNKKEYESSRKDYLLYEKGSVAFDFKPGYSRRYIIYRGSGKGYYIPGETNEIIMDFLKLGFEEQPAPPEHNGPADNAFVGFGYDDFYNKYY